MKKSSLPNNSMAPASLPVLVMKESKAYYHCMQYSSTASSLSKSILAIFFSCYNTDGCYLKPLLSSEYYHEIDVTQIVSVEWTCLLSCIRNPFRRLVLTGPDAAPLIKNILLTTIIHKCFKTSGYIN